MNEIAFTKVKLPFGWMSNMSPHPVTYDVDYRTAEALFQALRFNDSIIREAIRSQRSPMSAKMVAKKYKDRMTIVPQSTEDLANMEAVVRRKIEQNNLMADILRTGEIPIIEDCTARPHGSGLFWGAKRTESGWIGENHLGKIWMKIRAEHRETSNGTNLPDLDLRS